jgi:hypothetical protein
VALAVEVLGTGNAPRGVIGTEMSGASIPESAASGGAASTPGSSGAMHPELLRPYLPGSSDSVSLSINWRRVESEVGLACSQVTTAVAPPDTSLDPPQHSSPGPGQSRKEN